MKPKKTLKELVRLEKLLTKQTERSAKLLARRKKADEENPVTAGYFDRIAAQHAAALVDLSEIVHLGQTLSRQIMEADAAKAARKAAAKRDIAKKAKAAKAAAPVSSDAKADEATAKQPTKRPAKVAAPRTSKPAKPASKTAATQA